MAKPRLSSAARRAQLIDVARGVFAKKGFEPVSIEEIADRAHVSRPIVYGHFGSKNRLYAVIVDRELEYVTRRIVEALGAPTPRGRIQAATLAFLTYVRDHPDGFALLIQDRPCAGGSRAISGLLADLAERASSYFEADLTAGGHDSSSAPIFANALIGMVAYVGQWWTEVRVPPIEDVAARVAALAWLGLRQLPSTRASTTAVMSSKRRAPHASASKPKRTAESKPGRARSAHR